MNCGKILIAVENIDATMQAVRYVGAMVGSLPETHITLLHVYPEPPPPFYQQGGLLPDYQHQKEEESEKIFNDAQAILTESGVDPEFIDRRNYMAEGKTISRMILDIQQEGEFGTVVVGKRGVSKAEQFLFGSISNALVNSSGHFTVWVVG